jgi:hypothetical protein
MCFSPEADFVAAAVVGTIGVATLRQVRTRRELIVGSLPLLFAFHQFVEAFVWLGLRGDVSAGVEKAATYVYVLYAFAVLPMIVPLGFFLLEPIDRHRRWLRPFVALGVGVGVFYLWHVIVDPLEAIAHPHGIEYVSGALGGYLAAVCYVIATCGPALLSSRRYLRWFGVVNVVAAGFAFAVHQVEFASIWCLYAALASLLILEHFRRERQGESSRRLAAGSPSGR